MILSVLLMYNVIASKNFFEVNTTNLDYNYLRCPAAKILNETEEWNNRDKLVLKRAKFVCSTDERYKQNPCLKLLIKKAERRFLALCGVPGTENDFRELLK